MPNILESLYHGSLFPNEDIVSKDPDYRPLNRQITDSLETWRRRLSPDEFAELEALLICIHRCREWIWRLHLYPGSRPGRR